jgi:hypothetical protein
LSPFSDFSTGPQLSIDAKKRRGRHVASDEAHAWARSLPLNNPNAKTVLRALALYVNGEGCCFVGLDQLSEDTDLSADTVRRRMVWLEQVGAIVRLPQWLDANGVRNGEGRGKRTTDEVRLLLEADTDEIEARAKGDESAESSAISSTETTAISPSSQQGLNPDGETLSPRLAPRQPLQSCDHLTSEPEPESTPQPPSGGSVDADGWKEFQEDWQEPILRQSLAQQVWSVLKPEERTLARSAARGYVAWRKAQRKPPNVLSAHLFLREREAWAGFAAKAPDAKPAFNSGYDRHSLEGRAIVAMYEVARTRPFESRGRIVYSGEISPQVLTFAEAPERSVWQWIEDREQIGAWSNFASTHVQGARPAMIVKRGTGDDERSGIFAPWPWPPSAKGKIYTADTGPPGELSDQECADFK